ncbi:GyrI-like domain-containing protein [Dyadobacter subterraneus]|uniref:GyrI-like domain-containing protein n=1 Tax=Dyadobacter subterraneus TaxID=2773304 RepID=A0ABR9WKM0_9BACT|nr:GyrI-like domain-containing protein [Dyadobacter subterraneus]MBE9466025.1 GyrI-like domain-containing protein [Dyadobacter subterraneus]
MELKKIHPMQVLCFETKTKLSEIGEYVRVVAHKMYQAAVQNDLEITGPVYWIYEGMDGNPETVFSLTIALPITFKEKELSNSDFRLKSLRPFHCATTQHSGDWDKLGESYGTLIPQILSSGLTMSGENREIYLNMDFQNRDANTTEIQIGITEP